ncbi:MAG: argininosuccinate lyase [Chloroflexi bacterium]|nr:argininosuccinate lyase [Chloroflexota bacterium]MCC6892138.1 argininosuccinate lyase [Anaerolineae bacterium]
MLWGGAFAEPSDADLRALQDSISFDKRFYKQDIIGSIAYARAIAATGILTPDESTVIESGLRQVLGEFESGAFELKDGDEDIHTAVERRLTELVGAVGGKLHTGRSRNDQVATDFRLWVLDAMSQVDAGLANLQTALIEKADQHVEMLMPGYTHLQPAQPITAGHWLMSFFWMVSRDRDRLSDAARRAAVSPLGSGALAGTPFDVDRALLAAELGFQSYTENSLDGVSDRDFVAEFLFALALIGTHLSRLAEDIIIYSNPLFGYITLNDRYSTGSSIMPQKRNADPMELARGKTGRLIGNLTGLLVVLKGLPSTYDKDLQEDKEAVFDSVDNMLLLLPVVTAIITTLHLNPDKMKAALGGDMLATDLADYLVRKGLPFRQAHHISGQAVRLAASRGVEITSLTYDDFRGLSDLFTEDVMAVFDFAASVAKRKAVGGTAPEAVRQQITNAQKWLSEHQSVQPVQLK